MPVALLLLVDLPVDLEDHALDLARFDDLVQGPLKRQIKTWFEGNNLFLEKLSNLLRRSSSMFSCSSRSKLTEAILATEPLSFMMPEHDVY